MRAFSCGKGKRSFSCGKRSFSTFSTSDSQITKAMEQENDRFPTKPYLGTIAADEIRTLLPKIKKNSRVCWIMNTDPRGKPGTHWVAVYIDARPHGSHSVEYYDPLANPIPKEWLTDLKAVVQEIHGDKSYLKFRQNRITDQKDSNNCGPFCVHFLKARLGRGETFGKASGWDAAGERNIEVWKALPRQQMWISGQTGEGLRDIWGKIRNGAKRVVDRIRQTIGTAENGVQRASPSVRGWLSKYGHLPIESIQVCKKPIYSMIENIANWFSDGRLRENMDKLGYDRLMHLYMIIKLKDGLTIKIEKNHVVEIKKADDLGKVHLSLSGGLTVQSMLDAAEKKHGEKLWQYDAKTQNCQYFTIWFLGDKATTDIKQFVMQDAAKSLEGMGLLEKAARVVTDVAAVADVAMNGAGHKAK